MEEKGQNGEIRKDRDEKGRFVEGVYEGGPGRPKDTEEDKIKKKAIKEFIKEYQENLAEALPQISSVLIAEAQKGNIQAIKELNDRVMGKPPQRTDITSAGKPIPLLGGLSVNGSSNNGNEEVAEIEEKD